VNDSNLHETIISFFLQRQRPPTIGEMASRFRCDGGPTLHGLAIAALKAEELGATAIARRLRINRASVYRLSA
jgi:hypothetical protein